MICNICTVGVFAACITRLYMRCVFDVHDNANGMIDMDPMSIHIHYVCNACVTDNGDCAIVKELHEALGRMIEHENTLRRLESMNDDMTRIEHNKSNDCSIHTMMMMLLMMMMMIMMMRMTRDTSDTDTASETDESVRRTARTRTLSMGYVISTQPTDTVHTAIHEGTTMAYIDEYGCVQHNTRVTPVARACVVDVHIASVLGSITTESNMRASDVVCKNTNTDTGENVLSHFQMKRVQSRSEQTLLRSARVFLVSHMDVSEHICTDSTCVYVNTGLKTERVSIAQQPDIGNIVSETWIAENY